MTTNELKKPVTLYRNQFEKFMEDIFNSHIIERLSIEIDSIMFKIKYMSKNNMDLDKIPSLRDEFTQKAIEMRKAFSTFLFKFICQIVTIPEPFKLDDLTDILAENVTIDQTYIKFEMIVISDNVDFLKYIDSVVPDEDVYNMFPNEYFRFYTDSYNDGIAKAFPELFDNKYQDVIGTGDDSNVFVHSVTLQSSESCNLNCFPSGAKILMTDHTYKNIEDIQVGDEVLSVDENIIHDERAFDNEWFYNEDRLVPTKVTRVYQREAEVIGYGWKQYGDVFEDEDGNEIMDEQDCKWVTPDHPFLTSNREYIPFMEAYERDIAFIMYAPHWTVDSVCSYELFLPGFKKTCTVYNIETETHTFICDNFIVHNCTYCVGPDTLIHMTEGQVKKIKDIQVGDVVKVFDEYPPLKQIHPTKFSLENQIWDAKVLNVFKREAEVVEIKSPYIRAHLYITKDHKVLTNNGWKPVSILRNETDKIAVRDRDLIRFTSNYQIYNEPALREVYNIETESGTYIANGLCVHNCYQFNKTPMRMSLDTAIEFIENLVTDKYDFVNRYNSPAIILEFIGGEPFLEIDMTRKAYEYFLKRCYELNHPWFMLHRLSICSNGLLYFDKKVQDFFKDYSSQISFNISIDGNKKLHDSCRIQPNGEGSYDIAMAALNHFNKYYNKERNSKMTLAPSNISYLSESVIDFINNGMTVINLNCVFEEGWSNEHARIEYDELKKVANYLLDNDLESIYISIFREKQEGPLGKESDGSFCGASGSMLAVRPNGQFYPCIRFMPTSLDDGTKDFCMGCVKEGLNERKDNSDVLQVLDSITRRSQSNDICYECPIANMCASCQSMGLVAFNDVNKKTTFTCIMNVAETLANLYYWNAVKLKHPEWNIETRRNILPDNWALEVIDNEELDLLKKMELLNLMNERVIGDGA